MPNLNDYYWNKTGEFLGNFVGAIPLGGISRADYDSLELNVLDKVKHSGVKIAELGCYTGTATALFGAFAWNNAGKVTAIDWFKGSPNSNLMDLSPYINLKKILEDNLSALNLTPWVDILEKRSEEAVKDFPDEYFDLVFIDADHRYANVKQDIELWYPKVKTGGIIAGHDCEFSIKTAPIDVYEYPETDHVGTVEWGIHPGVVRAVCERFPNVNLEKDCIWWIHKS